MTSRGKSFRKYRKSRGLHWCRRRIAGGKRGWNIRERRERNIALFSLGRASIKKGKVREGI